MQLTRKIFLILGVLLNLDLEAQVYYVNIIPNGICSGTKAIPPNSLNDDISITNLPDPCMAYDIFEDLNLDLVFEDNFDTPVMDLTKWLGTTAQRSKKFNAGADKPPILDFYDGPITLPGNFDLSIPGTLKLLAKEVPAFMDNVFTYNVDGCTASDPGDCILGDGFPNRRRFNYTSGYLESVRSFKYGYFEMRCNIPQITGIWPAFWLSHLLGGNRTEIDIFEFTQDGGTCASPPSGIGDRKMFLTYWDWQGFIPSPNPTHPEICSSVDAYLHNAIGENINYTNAWHTYALYWDEFKMIWILDGYPIYEVHQFIWKKPHLIGSGADYGLINNCEDLWNAANDSEKEILANYFWPDEQSKLIINIAVENLGGLFNPDYSIDDVCTPFSGSKSMLIDYIRVYGIRACNTPGTVYYCGDNPGNEQSNITATDHLWLAPNCDVIISNPDPISLPNNASSHYVDAVAGNEITLSPGFWAQEGSVFDARIEPCETADLRHTSTGNNILSSKQIKDQIKLADKMANDKLQQSVQVSISPNTFNVFPNPTTGVIEFTINEELTGLTLLDITGAIVLDLSSQINNKSGIQTINLNSLSKGVYVLRVLTGSNTFMSNKIILN